MVEVVLGFTEEPYSLNELTSNYFPTKVGGKPAWLDLGNIPKKEELLCKRCSKQMSFLIQIYAPIDDKKECFHRSIYVFCCKNQSCQYYKVVRTQLPQENKFYPLDAEERKYDENYSELYTEEFLKSRQKTCEYCGCFAKSNCSSCQKVYYCSKEHQQADWDLGHREQCKFIKDSSAASADESSLPKKKKSELLFKEFDIINETEELKDFPPTKEGDSIETPGNDSDDDDDDDEDDEDDVDLDENGNPVFKNEIGKELVKVDGEITTNDPDVINKFNDYVEETGKSGNFNEETFSKIKDKSLIYFKRIVAKSQDQVLRYCRDENYPILWVSDTDQINKSDIPSCENCGSSRKFEFQIIPTLLYFLEMDSSLANNANDIDFGILSIYTCENSCERKLDSSNSFINEFIFKQDFKK